MTEISATSFSGIDGALNTGVNTLLFPLMGLIINLFVVWPINTLLKLLETINWISGSQLANALFFSASGDSIFYKTFIYIASITGVLFVFIFGAALIKAVVQGDKKPGQNSKMTIVELIKKSGIALIIVIAIPSVFLVLVNLLSFVTGLLTNALFTVDDKSSAFQAIKQVFLQSAGNKADFDKHFDYFVIQRTMVAFNIWLVGYDIGADPVAKADLARAILTPGNDLNNVVKLIASQNDSSFFNLNLGSLSQNPISYNNLNNWNIFLLILAALVCLYLILTFIVSVMVRMLEIFALILIAPVIIFGSITIEKSNTKWIVKTFHKMLAANVALFGYYLFNFLYLVLIQTSLEQSNTPFRIMQFVILFGGMVFINQIPRLMLEFWNNREVAVANELQQAKQTFNVITKPLTTAIGGTIIAANKAIRNQSISHMKKL